MPSIKLNGIVTRYADYKENDRILTLFTREQGLVSCASRGCRRANSPLIGASELFVCGEFVLFKAGDKHTLDSAEISERFYPLREDIAKFAAASYMLSLINAGAEETANIKLYSLLRYSLAYTAYSQLDAADMAICFALRCLNALGYRPSVTECAICGMDIRSRKSAFFSADHGGALCPGCARAVGAKEISALSLEAIRRMLLLKDEDISRVALPKSAQAELKEAVNSFAEYSLERKFKAMECL